MGGFLPTGGGLGFAWKGGSGDGAFGGVGVGRRLFRNAEGVGVEGAGGAGAEGGAGGAPGGAPGGRGGAAAVGGRGASDGRTGSGSELVADSAPRPVLTPPLVLFNLGIPPARMPPNWGTAGPAPALPGASLFARDLFAPGTGGASPGIGGAPPMGGAPPPPPPPEEPPIEGADRSLVTAFLSRVPF